MLRLSFGRSQVHILRVVCQCVRAYIRMYVHAMRKMYVHRSPTEGTHCGPCVGTHYGLCGWQYP